MERPTAIEFLSGIVDSRIPLAIKHPVFAGKKLEDFDR